MVFVQLPLLCFQCTLFTSGFSYIFFSQIFQSSSLDAFLPGKICENSVDFDNVLLCFVGYSDFAHQKKPPKNFRLRIFLCRPSNVSPACSDVSKSAPPRGVETKAILVELYINVYEKHRNINHYHYIISICIKKTCILLSYWNHLIIVYSQVSFCMNIFSHITTDTRMIYL